MYLRFAEKKKKEIKVKELSLMALLWGQELKWPLEVPITAGNQWVSDRAEMKYGRFVYYFSPHQWRKYHFIKIVQDFFRFTTLEFPSRGEQGKSSQDWEKISVSLRCPVLSYWRAVASLFLVTTVLGHNGLPVVSFLARSGWPRARFC